MAEKEPSQISERIEITYVPWDIVDYMRRNGDSLTTEELEVQFEYPPIATIWIIGELKSSLLIEIDPNNFRVGEDGERVLRTFRLTERGRTIKEEEIAGVTTIALQNFPFLSRVSAEGLNVAFRAMDNLGLSLPVVKMAFDNRSLRLAELLKEAFEGLDLSPEERRQLAKELDAFRTDL